ncbi:DUF4145 domain-containing protein [Corallococcus sp. AS-1-6]|uniref:DUF4145 domain-containing protein n=1 Tax=Corallococcus sp. AS-1-6 TaxID=2874599 RepID=UPI001CBDE4AA|nr:DUF4145 domain-containing protein [Corallococcus sp. AS-1-6]MBZ4376456.1 DUF4145 domain-containing protein [Corallococcus sp. AS-1-6]
MAAEHRSLSLSATPSWPRPAWIEDLPARIQGMLTDVYALADNGPSPLGMAGLRMLLEQVVRDGVDVDGNLRRRLYELHNRGFITTHHHERLVNVITHGNAAVHEGASVSGEEFRYLLMSIEHLLLGYFVLRQPALGLPQNKAGQAPRLISTP